MRVISGTAKGKKLLSPDGLTVRPTIDRVKEALFSMIQFELAGRRFLDLFAGSGQIGIEALSRGAAFAVFVEQSPQVARLMEQNVAHTELSDRACVKTISASQFLRSFSPALDTPFHLAFLDPPYQDDLLDESFLADVAALLSPGGTLICEHLASQSLPDLPQLFESKKNYRYGKVSLTRYSACTPTSAALAGGEESPQKSFRLGSRHPSEATAKIGDTANTGGNCR